MCSTPAHLSSHSTNTWLWFTKLQFQAFHDIYKLSYGTTKQLHKTALQSSFIQQPPTTIIPMFKLLNPISTCLLLSIWSIWDSALAWSCANNLHNHFLIKLHDPLDSIPLVVLWWIIFNSGDFDEECWFFDFLNRQNKPMPKWNRFYFQKVKRINTLYRKWFNCKANSMLFRVHRVSKYFNTLFQFSKQFLSMSLSFWP